MFFRLSVTRSDITRYWWLYVSSGILWVLFGMWLWSYGVGSLVALAALMGVTMIFNGVPRSRSACAYPHGAGS
jgi:uncharacterized membrane protein HdeD (DUF308 family)